MDIINCFINVFDNLYQNSPIFTAYGESLPQKRSNMNVARYDSFTGILPLFFLQNSLHELKILLHGK